MRNIFSLLFTVLILVLLPFEVTIQGQDIVKYPVLERLAIPEGTSYNSELGYCTDTVYFTLFITEDTLAPSQAMEIKFDFVPLEPGRAWVSSIRTVTEDGEHRYEAFVYQQKCKPTDVNCDGKTNFKDLWMVLVEIF